MHVSVVLSKLCNRNMKAIPRTEDSFCESRLEPSGSFCAFKASQLTATEQLLASLFVVGIKDDLEPLEGLCGHMLRRESESGQGLCGSAFSSRALCTPPTYLLQSSHSCADPLLFELTLFCRDCGSAKPTEIPAQ